MDNVKVGALIRKRRLSLGYTQLQLAEQLRVSDKAVSKWERGFGCPDVSLLPNLANALGVNLEELLEGNMDVNEQNGGNMRKLQFYVCPDCGNILTATGEATVSCCGKKLQAIQPQKTEEKLTVELIENEYFIKSEHPMEKDHYISFVAFLTGDTLILRKQYAEWNLQTRIPRVGHGMLVWYCTRHGLFCQLV